MTYLESIAQTVSTNRQQIEVDLADALSRRHNLQTLLDETNREVNRLEGLLSLGTTPSPTSDDTAQEERLTLHEAMRRVLSTAPSQTMGAAELARTIERRGLYKMRDGRPVEQQQIHARVGHYRHMFERSGHGIRLL
jgi:hypothetical protein